MAPCVPERSYQSIWLGPLSIGLLLEKGMARDVDVALARILAEAARGDDEAGRAKLKELAKAGRYQRDVY